MSNLKETKSAPKGFHFTKDGKLKRGDADRDGPGGPMFRSDPLDKQRSKVPPVSEATSRAQQAAIAIALQKAGKKPKNESTFKNFRNSLEEKTLTPAEKKKREEVAKAIERENPNMPMGMKMAIATKTAKRVAEDSEVIGEVSSKMALSYSKAAQQDMANSASLAKLSRISKGPGSEEEKKHEFEGQRREKGLEMAMKKIKEDIDEEGKMARGQLMRMANQASALAQMMDDDKQLDGWVQSKLTMASDYLDSVHDYLMHNKQDVDEMDEETHFCAKHVYSSMLGEGIVLEAQHADPDEYGDIEWYLVEFKNGIHKVYTEDLQIMVAEYHGNHKKKKRMTNG